MLLRIAISHTFIFLSPFAWGTTVILILFISRTVKLTGGDGAQRNPRPVQRFVRCKQFVTSFSYKDIGHFSLYLLPNAMVEYFAEALRGSAYRGTASWRVRVQCCAWRRWGS